MSDSTKQWFSLYTKPGAEKKVANILSRKNIENYCPLQRQWNGKKIVISAPLFKSFVFVQIAEADFQKIRLIDGVLNFVYWLGKPAVIQDDEIEIMKNFMNEYIYVKLERVPFSVDGLVRVVEGAAEVNKANKITIVNNQVRILLPSLGYVMFAEVETAGVSAQPVKSESLSIFEKYQFNFKHRLAIQ